MCGVFVTAVVLSQTDPNSRGIIIARVGIYKIKFEQNVLESNSLLGRIAPVLWLEG